MFPLKPREYIRIPQLDKRKVIKYKCRACNREFTMNNRVPGSCVHCGSKLIHEK